MQPSAEVLIHEILDMKKITLRKLAAVTRIKESTIIRILSGYEEHHSPHAYMKLAQYKSKLMQTNVLIS